MSSTTPLSSILMGSESLLVRCANTILRKGIGISAVISNNREILDWADENGIQKIRPSKDLVSDVADLDYDFFFSITNFRIVPDAVLSRASKMAINFHDGPLPSYAGLNVPSWALINGETSHAITWHEMSAGIDKGAILEQSTFQVGPNDTAFDLNTRCYEAATSSFSVLLDKLVSGSVTKTEQDFSTRQYFAKDKRPLAGGTIDWRQSASQIHNMIRAMDYGAYDHPLGFPKVVYRNTVLIPTRSSIVDNPSAAQPATIVESTETSVTVATANGAIKLEQFLNLSGQALQNLTRLGLQAGEALYLFTPDELDGIDALVQASSKNDRKWLKTVRNIERLDYPFSQTDSPTGPNDRVEETVEIPNGVSVQDALGLASIFLSRVAGQNDPSIMYLDKSTGDPESNVVFQSALPVNFSLNNSDSLRRNVDSLTNAFERAVDLGSYQCDLPIRDTRLREAAGSVYPDILVSNGPGGESTIRDYDLVLLASSSNSITWSFKGGLESEHSARQVTQRFASALNVLANNSDSLLADLPLVTSEEIDHLVNELNDTAVEFDAVSRIDQMIAAQAAATPNAPALTYRGQSISYSDMEKRANKLAHRLIEMGVGPDVFVGLCTDRSFDLVVSAVAIWKAGGAYVPLDPDFPNDRLEHMVRDSGLSIIVTQSGLKNKLPETTADLLVLDADDAIAGKPDTALESSATSENLAYAIYTSGSTGLPKGVLVEHRSVSNFFRGMDDVIEQDGDKRWLAVTSLSFDISVLELFWTLCRGFEVVLFEGIDSDSGQAVSKNSRPIKFSLFYFSSDESERPGDKYKLLLEGARFGDENGFYGVWTPERHFHAFGGLYPNPSVTSAALSTITNNIRLFAGSCVSPLHHSIRVAEEWSVVDNLSNGRVSIAFASGWQPNDFILQPQNFADKKGVMFRQIEEVQALWQGKSMPFTNPEGKEIQVRVLPHPVQKELPVWITTAGNPETFRMAGEKGYNVLTHMLGQTANEVRDSIEVYRQAREAAGHEGPGMVSLMLHTFVGTDSDAVKELVREPMKQYLRSSLGLIRDAAWSFPTFRSKTTDNHGKFTMDNLSDEDTDAVMDLSFERYYESAGLFGTVDECVELVDDLKAMGVDDVACLIDFGVNTDAVLESLPLLKQVMDACNSHPEASGETLAELIDSRSITHLQCTPSMARMLVADSDGRSAAGALKHMMVGGEAFPPTLAKELSATVGGKITNMYGPTETTIWSSTYDLGELMNPMPIGTPIANTSLYILDENLNLVPKGSRGELYIGGDGVTRGYHDRAELTAERFVADPFAGNGQLMYKTGDLCKYLPDGRVQFLGRNDFQVKIRGYRIELGEIESVMEEFPGVKEAVVIVREDTPGDQRITGYVVTETQSSVDIESLTDHIRSQVPDYMVPSVVLELDNLPLTPNKKVDRKALPAPRRGRAASAEEIAKPESDLENQISDIWREALKIETISVNDNFFDLGGHSLLAVQVNDKLKDLLSREISLVDLFRYPTIRTLSAHLSNGSGEKAETARDAGTSRAEERRKAMMRRRRTRGTGNKL